ncbi:MAG: hypothetical protein ACRC5T_04385 [Cetobacterium sp.]
MTEFEASNGLTVVPDGTSLGFRGPAGTVLTTTLSENLVVALREFFAAERWSEAEPKPLTQTQFKEQNASYRVVWTAEDGRLVDDRMYMNKSGLSSAINRGKVWEGAFGWSYTVSDRQADGTWKARP